MTRDWIIKGLPDVAEGDSLPGVTSLIASLLASRGIASQDDARCFLTPQLGGLYPPSNLGGMERATEIVADAVAADKSIVLYGDYDVDGTTGIAILWHTLTLAGARVTNYVPHRIQEGYGLNPEACRKIADAGATLVISIDCGITACESADVLADRGVSLVITDHHQPSAELPRADAIVHPLIAREYENPGLCGAGVAFKLAWGIAQRLSGADRVAPEFKELLAELLPLAALGTIADIVPLTGENRIIAFHGLRRLVDTRLTGLRALLKSTGLSSNVTAFDVGFKLAPRINAAGRMGHADIVVDLLTTASAARAEEIAGYLDEQNSSRQATERRISKEAQQIVEDRNLASDARRGIVVAGEDWHPGVIGIVASRLVDRFHRPSVVIALQDGEGQGSARSIDHFDLSAALGRCDDLLLGHGGHSMAAGLRISADRVDAFTERFLEIANQGLTGRDVRPRLHLDAEVAITVLDERTVHMIEQFGPFGRENHKPRFCTDWLDLAQEPRCVGQTQRHLKASFHQNGTHIQAIGFGLGTMLDDLKHHRKCRVAFEPIINEFNGRRSVELHMLDLKFPE